MKKQLALLLVILACPLFAFIKVETTPTHTLYTVHLEGYEVNEIKIGGKTFSEVHLKGVKDYEGSVFKKGWPDIPVVNILLEGEGEIQFDSLDSDSVQKLKYPVLTHRDPIPRSPRHAPPPLFDVEEPLIDSAFIPAKKMEVIEQGISRGRLVRLVTLAPVRYRLSNKELIFTSDFTVRVAHPPVSKKIDQIERETVGFVVSENFKNSPSLKKYLTYKNSLGYFTKIQYVSPQDSADAIRGVLRSWYEDSSHPLRYVLIVGEEKLVRAHKTKRINGPTDHYYRCLDTDNYENDIGTPDVNLGRFSVRTEEELSIVLEKNILYQEGKFSDSSWLNHLSYIATDDTSNDNWKMSEAAHNYSIEQYTSGHGYLGNFPGTLEKGGDRLYAVSEKATSNHMMESLQKGRSLVVYSGHGEINEWEGPKMTQEDVQKLQHPESLPFVISNACYTAKYDEASFAETWQKHRWGSIYFWGSVDVLFWDPADDHMNRAVYDGIYKHKLSRFGEITDYSLREGWRYLGGKGYSKYYYETYASFGDPSIAFHRWSPKKAVVVGPTEISKTNNVIEFKIQDERSLPFSNLRVALKKMGSVYSVSAITDATGSVKLRVNKNVLTNGSFEGSVSGSTIQTERFTLSIQ